MKPSLWHGVITVVAVAEAATADVIAGSLSVL
jgi:hypothetical protein